MMAKEWYEAKADYAHAREVSAKARIDLELAAQRQETARRAWEAAKMAAAKEIPVDRSAVQLTDGSSVPEDRSHTAHIASGQQKGYIVLTEAERAKGFVRPVRDAYRHTKCGSVTTMGRSLAETYARDPAFYSGTFCCICRNHFPVGEDGEFIWLENDGHEIEKVGT